MLLIATFTISSLQDPPTDIRRNESEQRERGETGETCDVLTCAVLTCAVLTCAVLTCVVLTCAVLYCTDALARRTCIWCRLCAGEFGHSNGNGSRVARCQVDHGSGSGKSRLSLSTEIARTPQPALSPSRLDLGPWRCIVGLCVGANRCSLLLFACSDV